MHTIQLNDFVSSEEVAQLVSAARAEDLGTLGLDVTSQAFVDAGEMCEAVMAARETGVLSGAALAETIAATYDPAISVDVRLADGSAIQPGDAAVVFRGPLRSVLGMERIALNFATHLSGIASLTARYAAACEGTAAKVYDTRKTLPGLRGLEKYAVACGGGGTHRIGLYDAMLIKDNHIAHVPLDQLAATLREAGKKARALNPDLKFVQVEVDTLEQLEVVLTAPVDIVLLDNMPPSMLLEAVAMRDAAAPSVELEASGGITLQTIGDVARTGVNRISVGALTHSAPSLDLGLDIH